ncbi:hypothetical protein [Leeuwenhoekiella sp. ZYFB001]|uniref:hypothetical protein n=1 Tax=Leeuwenhoekiella sp. ZYFB001 TaxID=2719912 RepID=UPI0014304F2D|nr:hypothetical protein [Leeuwenhoekiella sp. ZYFB001]
MSSLEELRENYPDLVEEYSAMDKEQLLEQICAEVLDLHRMDERVQVFMNECTLNMSKTNYTPEVIKTLISAKQEHDINEFCSDMLAEYEDDPDEMINQLEARAEEIIR